MMARFLGFSLLALLVLSTTQSLEAQVATTTDAESAPEETVIETDERVLPTSYRIEQLVGEQVYGDFVVGPGKTELELAPGQTRTVTLSLSNRTGTAKLFKLEIEDAAGSDDPMTPVVLLGDDTGPYTLKDYLSVEDDTFILEHNQKVHIPVRVSLPADAEPGGRYGSVLVTTTSVEAATMENGAPRSAVVSRIGTLFFITTPGLGDRQGQLEHFSTIPDGKRWYRQPPINFGILYRNEGLVHVNPYGEVRITNLLGNEVALIEIDPWYAMPQSTRLREVGLDRAWMFGYYTATLELNRGYDNVIDTASYSFFVIDWLIVVLIAFGIAALLLVLRFLVTRFEFKRRT